MLAGVLLAVTLASQTVLTTRLAPPPARISLDGGYRDILLSLQPDLCRGQPSERRCAQQAVRKIKVLTVLTGFACEKFPQKYCDRQSTCLTSPAPSPHFVAIKKLLIIPPIKLLNVTNMHEMLNCFL